MLSGSAIIIILLGSDDYGRWGQECKKLSRKGMLSLVYLQNNKKAICITLLIMFFVIMFTPIAFANTIMDRVQDAQGTDSVSQLEGKISEAAESFITFLRNTAIIVAVVMFVLVAYALLFSPDVRTIGDCKGRVGALALAIFVAVMAEQIVGTFLSWVN